MITIAPQIRQLIFKCLTVIEISKVQLEILEYYPKGQTNLTRTIWKQGKILNQKVAQICKLNSPTTTTFLQSLLSETGKRKSNEISITKRRLSKRQIVLTCRVLKVLKARNGSKWTSTLASCFQIKICRVYVYCPLISSNYTSHLWWLPNSNSGL